MVLLLASIVYIDINRPKPIDWSPTFKIEDKIPLGLYVFNEELTNFFPKQEIKPVTITPYEYFDELYDYDSLIQTYTTKGTFIAVQENNQIDEESIEEIMTFVAHGNDAFLSMKYFSDSLLDSLHFETTSTYYYKDTLQNYLANPKLGKAKYLMNEGVGNNHFNKIDTLNTTVLGYQKIGDTSYVNFIKVPFKKGNFYLHTQPAAFSNFYMLKNNNVEYVQKMLSYLPDENVFWYQKSAFDNSISQSPMRFILSQPALKSAWFLFLIGMIIFMIFNAKRRQRVIPIIKPLSNTTVDFTKTIGNLYFQEANHDNVMEKKIVYLLEKIRHDYMMDTSKLDDDFIKKLHLKTGKDLALIEKIVRLIQKQKKRFKSTEEDLVDLNQVIEKFLETK